MTSYNITNKKILAYAFLPQVVPRVRTMFAQGFQNLAYFMALVYRAANLLPVNHSYLRTDMIGQYTIRQVIAEASRNLNFSKKYIDQIIVFFALIVGIILLVLQFFILLVSFLINPAAAQGQGENIFLTPAPDDDIALKLLDRVFGVPNLFGSSEATGKAFHVALHQLLQFYSVGLLVVAVMIVIYFIFAILAETAQTGTPFGKRYNHAWAPIRLVVAIGLLIPIGTGLNSAQWITLYAAKFGSGFATNGWLKFNDIIKDTYIPSEELVAKPNVPELRDISAFIMMAHACKAAYQLKKPEIGSNIQAYLINGESGLAPLLMSGGAVAEGGSEVIQPTASAQGYLSAYENSDKRSIRIRFGEYSFEYEKEEQKVRPYCGEINISIPRNPTSENGSDGDTSLSGEGNLNARYYILIRNMWEAAGEQSVYVEMKKAAENMIERRLDHGDEPDPQKSLQTQITTQAKEFVAEGVEKAISDLIKEFQEDKNYERYGWGGAGIFYNDIANVNGRLTAAALNKPQITSYPYAMEYTCDKNKQQNNATSPEECYNPRLAKGLDAQFESQTTKVVASALSDVFNYWHKDPDDLTGNAFIDTINVVMGTQGLFDLCSAANIDIHPLAQLSSVGKGLVDAAIRNLGFGLGTGAASILTPYFGPALQSASSFLVTVASIGILIGFILFYVLPFLPFLYFLFAVGGWVKGLFEAMVGVPLWALAHIRIDGQGLPGDGAINGYFLIFEIFIRPILIVFGLLASILVFGAMVKVLNEVFSLVTSNLSGFDGSASTNCGADSGTGSAGAAPTGSIEYLRGPVDEFFFTILYAIIVYLIATSSFKLIDLIPNNILRWMGAGVQTFNDQAGEPADGLLTKIAVGGSLAGNQLQSAGSSLGQAFSSGATGVKNLAQN